MPPTGSLQIGSVDQPYGILVVDDEAPQMQAICDALRDQGYREIGRAHV